MVSVSVWNSRFVCTYLFCAVWIGRFMTNLGNIWPQMFMLNKYFENIYVFNMMCVRVKSRHKGQRIL